MRFIQTLSLLTLCATLMSACASLNPTLDISHAATYENTKYLQEYIDKGVDVNFQDDTGESPLISAARFGNIENIQLLLANGANIHLKDNDGYTAITVVNQSKPVNQDIIALLLEYGANINDSSNDGDNLLASAFLYHELDDDRSGDIAFFLNQGFNANAKEKDGTPLFWKICGLDEKEDFKSLIDVFLDNGVDLNLKDAENDTLLALSSCQEKEAIYDYLVSKGVE